MQNLIKQMMKLSKIIKYYILLCILPLLGIIVINYNKNMMYGFLLGMLVSIAQIILNFIKVDSLISNATPSTKKRKMIFSNLYFVGMIIVALTYYVSMKFWGINALLACFLATLLQKPTYYTFKNGKGGVK